MHVWGGRLQLNRQRISQSVFTPHPELIDTGTSLIDPQSKHAQGAQETPERWEEQEEE